MEECQSESVGAEIIMKILIADDSIYMRNVLRDILSKEGHTLIEAENGVQAMEKFDLEKPDMVLLDIIMPQADGLEVLKKIGKTAKVIVISAVGQEKMVEEAKDLGALDYIVKPFDNQNVLEVVKKHVS
jgi:two-component system, chemotaxis family, chemotaxis protein CheY